MDDVAAGGILACAEPAPLGVAGVEAWTTTSASGSFGLGSDEPVYDVITRWNTLEAELRERGATRLASATQVHGAAVSLHGDGWNGWLRQHGVDGHVTCARGTSLVVTVADCTPVFIAHPTAVALLHAGWRGTASGIMRVGLEALQNLGCAAENCVVHLGPSICGSCYEVGPEVARAVTGKPAMGKSFLDVRAVLAEQAASLGVRQISTSPWCTRCGGGQFFSHRGGSSGRQLGVIFFRGR